MKGIYNHGGFILNKKIGLQPGTLIYTGNRELTTEILITHYTYNCEFFKKNSFIFKENLPLNLSIECINWINIGGIHNIDLIKKIGEKFKIDSLILEDILNNNQRPKLEVRDDYIFLTLKMISNSNENYFHEYEQVSFILFQNILITFQENSFDVFDNIRTRIEKKVGRLRNKKVGYLIYALIDRIIDNYFLIIENLENSLDNIEDKVISNPNKHDFNKILEIKKEILKFKKSVAPLKEVLSKLKDPDIKEYLGEDIDTYLFDLQDHIIITNEAAETIFSRGNELIQLYHSTISTGMNEIMKVLTMISSIFIPLSFLVGLYGMNFEYIPELSFKYGYFILLGFMSIIIIFIGYFFKNKKWW